MSRKFPMTAGRRSRPVTREELLELRILCADVRGALLVAVRAGRAAREAGVRVRGRKAAVSSQRSEVRNQKRRVG